MKEFILAFSLFISFGEAVGSLKSCDQLLPGQYRCNRIERLSPLCPENEIIPVSCFTAPNITCYNGTEYTPTTYFEKNVSCTHSGGYSFETALLLSIFFGWAGIDRFYLGYPAIGLLKLCTFGFMFFWHLVDALLIALQLVLPADGSFYSIHQGGPVMIRVFLDNNTYFYQPNIQ